MADFHSTTRTCGWTLTIQRRRQRLLFVHVELSAPGPSTPSKLCKSNLASHSGQYFIFRPASFRTYSHDPAELRPTDLLPRNSLLALIWSEEQTRVLFSSPFTVLLLRRQHREAYHFINGGWNWESLTTGSLWLVLTVGYRDD